MCIIYTSTTVKELNMLALVFSEVAPYIAYGVAGYFALTKVVNTLIDG